MATHWQSEAKRGWTAQTAAATWSAGLHAWTCLIGLFLLLAVVLTPCSYANFAGTRSQAWQCFQRPVIATTGSCQWPPYDWSCWCKWQWSVCTHFRWWRSSRLCQLWQKQLKLVTGNTTHPDVFKSVSKVKACAADCWEARHCIQAGFTWTRLTWALFASWQQLSELLQASDTFLHRCQSSDIAWQCFSAYQIAFRNSDDVCHSCCHWPNRAQVKHGVCKPCKSGWSAVLWTGLNFVVQKLLAMLNQLLHDCLVGAVFFADGPWRTIRSKWFQLGRVLKRTAARADTP